MLNDIKIGLDFHGVITKHPEYFSEFCRCALSRGYEIHIITGGPQKVVEEYLRKHQILYTVIFAILDFYDAKGDVDFFDNGEFKVPDQLWNSAKAEYCITKGINMHIDDSTQYAKWFTTPFCHYDAQTRKCLTSENIEIDFSQAADVALNQIADIVKRLQFF